MNRKETMKIQLIAMLLCLAPFAAGQTIELSLERTIQLAADSSLEAFRSKNLYLSGYWEYRNYKAERLPSLIRWAYTMFAVILSWVLFRSVDLGQAWAYLGAMFGQTTGLAQDGQALYYLLQFWPEWVLALIAFLPVGIIAGKIGRKCRCGAEHNGGGNKGFPEGHFSPPY